MALSFIEKCRTISVGVSRSRISEIRSHIDPASAMGKIAKDDVMLRQILKGNGSDKVLKQEVIAMEETRVKGERLRKREEKKAKIKDLKDRYRSRYGGLIILIISLLMSGCVQRVVYKCPEGQVAILEDGREMCYSPGVSYTDYRAMQTKKLKHLTK